MKSILSKKKSGGVVFLCFVFFLSLQIYASIPSEKSSGLPVRSYGRLAFDVDICQYRLTEDKTLVEIFYSMNLTQLVSRYSTVDSNAVLNVDFRLITNTKKSLTELHERKVVSLYNLIQNNTGYNLIDLKKFELEPQSLIVELAVKDSASGLVGRVVYPLTVREFGSTFSLSDLFFVSHVQKATGESIFEKHGVFMIPNPSRVFYVKNKSSKLFLYYELNNLVYNSDSPSYYSVNYAIYGLNGKEVLPLTSKMVLKTAPLSARVEIIPLDGLSTGVYKLTLTAMDQKSSKSQTASRYFQVYSEDGEDNLLLPMSEQDVKRYFDQIKYIATNTEKTIFKQLNSKGKQQFLLNFWKSRDPDPATPENEFMEEHFRRLAYCEANFEGGINSDMGRIYIQFGPPIDVQRDFSSIEYAKPVIIWTYAIDGRSEFVFVDRSGDGKYALVHSTYRDEYSNPNWMNDMKQETNRK